MRPRIRSKAVKAIVLPLLPSKLARPRPCYQWVKVSVPILFMTAIRL
jgi:hypothetical protein